MAADQLLRLPAGEPLARVRDEGEPCLVVDRPDQVRRVFDQVAVARLGFAPQAVEALGGQRDRGLVGEDLEQVDLIVADLALRSP